MRTSTLFTMLAMIVVPTAANGQESAQGMYNRIQNAVNRADAERDAKRKRVAEATVVKPSKPLRKIEKDNKRSRSELHEPAVGAIGVLSARRACAGNPGGR